ncbi:MAG: ATP-binding cassette domain-containing protein [Magnetococcales bacterium]|nr:ATP-binding cassette domain-containing protein [Magnetococcales bacterium]
MSNSLKTLELQAFIGPKLSTVISQGQIVFLTGSSGSGKSLLLRAIADLDPHKGEVWFNNQKAMDTHPTIWRKQVGYLPPNSFWWDDVVANNFDNCEDALVYMEAMDLPKEAFDWQLMRMSTGEKQRMSIVRLLSNQPKVLLLDEPTANLDPKTVRAVESMIIEYTKKNNCSVIWVSHDLDQVKRVAHRHLAIDEKQISEKPL